MITTDKGLIYRDGKALHMEEADALAQAAGFQYVEELVKALETFKFIKPGYIERALEVLNPTLQNELRGISAALDVAGDLNLEAEVIWSAMKYIIEKKGDTTIIDAIDHGVNEWIK